MAVRGQIQATFHGDHCIKGCTVPLNRCGRGPEQIKETALARDKTLYADHLSV